MSRALLERSRRFEDEAAGFAEEFLRPELRSGRTVAVLTTPVARPRSTGFVMCHSFGPEQLHLYRLDVTVARRLAGAGFSVLRFHGRAYGDHCDPGDVGGLRSHLDDAADAVRVLAEAAPVPSVGVAGARFGGTVAALVAQELGLPAAALWEPAVRGSRLMRGLLRSKAYQEMAAASNRGGHPNGQPAERAGETLERQGWVDVRGLRLTLDAYREMVAFDLATDLGSLRADVLLLSVTRTDRPTGPAAELAARLLEMGVRTTVQTVHDVLAGQLGEYHYTNEDDLSTKEDRHFDLFDRVADRTVAWAVRREEAAGR